LREAGGRQREVGGGASDDFAAPAERRLDRVERDGAHDQDRHASPQERYLPTSRSSRSRTACGTLFGSVRIAPASACPQTHPRDAGIVPTVSAITRRAVSAFLLR